MGSSKEFENRLIQQEELAKTFATREWVYLIFLKYSIPIIGLIVGGVISGVLYSNHRMVLMIINSGIGK